MTETICVICVALTTLAITLAWIALAEAARAHARIDAIRDTMGEVVNVMELQNRRITDLECRIQVVDRLTFQSSN